MPGWGGSFTDHHTSHAMYSAGIFRITRNQMVSQTMRR
jgi:hypothetical protein